MNKELLKEYLVEAKFDYDLKKEKQANYASNIVFTSKSRTYTLEEVNNYIKLDLSIMRLVQFIEN